MKVNKLSIAEHKVRVVFAKLALAVLAGYWHVNINLTSSFCGSSKHLENSSTNSEWLYCEVCGGFFSFFFFSFWKAADHTTALLP